MAHYCSQTARPLINTYMGFSRKLKILLNVQRLLCSCGDRKSNQPNLSQHHTCLCRYGADYRGLTASLNQLNTFRDLVQFPRNPLKLVSMSVLEGVVARYKLPTGTFILLVLGANCHSIYMYGDRNNDLRLVRHIGIRRTPRH